MQNTSIVIFRRHFHLKSHLKLTIVPITLSKYNSSQGTVNKVREMFMKKAIQTGLATSMHLHRSLLKSVQILLFSNAHRKISNQQS